MIGTTCINCAVGFNLAGNGTCVSCNVNYTWNTTTQECDIICSAG